MKKLFLTILLVIFAGYANAYEHISMYDVDITINDDSSILVDELISVKAEGNNIRLGIYRDIPTRYAHEGKNYKTPVNVLAVYRNGKPENFWVEHHRNYDRIQIGARTDSGINRLEYGYHTYEIIWQTTGHLRSYEKLDELYFNAIGNYWDFEIQKARAKVTLPENINVQQFIGYYGFEGDTNVAQSSQLEHNTIVFEAQKLHKKQGLTVAVGFDKGILDTTQIPVITNPFVRLLMKIPFINEFSSILILSIIFILAYYYVFWNLYGKDYPLGAIMPIFKPSKEITPSIASALWRSGHVAKNKAFTASLVHMAANKHIKIKDKALERTDSHPELSEEKDIRDNMFSGAQSVSLEKYNSKFEKAFNKYSSYVKKLRSILVKQNRKFIFLGFLLQLVFLFVMPEGKIVAFAFLSIFGIMLFYSPFYFSIYSLLNSNNKATGIFMALFIVPHSMVFLIFLPLSIMIGEGSISTINFSEIIFLILLYSSIFVHVLFFFLMDKPSAKATKLIAELKGLRMFIAAVDENRYKLITPSVFEENLPYAIIFGLEEKWVKEFNKLYPNYKPDWYASSKPFRSSSLNSMAKSFSSASRSPSSGRSGGGFSGGGGRSGGGSGGGGGGGR